MTRLGAGLLSPESPAGADDAADYAADHGSSDGEQPCVATMPAVMMFRRRRGRRRVMPGGGCRRATGDRGSVSRGPGGGCVGATAFRRCRSLLMHRRLSGGIPPAMRCRERRSAESRACQPGDNGFCDDVDLVHITPAFLGFLPSHQARNCSRQCLTDFFAPSGPLLSGGTGCRICGGWLPHRSIRRADA